MDYTKGTTAETTDAPIGADDTAAEQSDVTNTEASQDAQNTPTHDFLNDPTVISYIEKAVQEGIQKALKGTPPKANTVDVSETEKKNFERMTYKERIKLYKSNPQAYHKLSKGTN